MAKVLTVDQLLVLDWKDGVPRLVVVGGLLVLHRLQPDAARNGGVLAGLAERSGRPVEAAGYPPGRVRLRVQLL